ncbi:Sucrose transport protein SUC3 [Acorus gramineus]|uniref:Sucrose transport protein SUC3 n=1 Tax=Acorus gramineus TaxID=55184 RepID=A0AAV9ARX6_ACOGR|nr:Sucrose transport protein SUC3 [Acorus gramineus]
MDAVSIRVPYKHLKQSEVELAGLGADRDGIGQDSRVSNGGSDVPLSSPPSPPLQTLPSPANSSSLKTLILSCMVAAGVQFGWALQLSLLTPYIQTLGIEHAFSSFIWLCGPITGFVVQPCVGIWSDRCHSKYGRRRPFILVGVIMICVAVTIIGFSADIGYLFGDTKESCRDFKGTRTGAAIVFVIGFWILDLANNTVQGPARALLADLSGPQQCNSANAIFCSWMAVGNILGFSAGSTRNWHRWFPFLTTKACCEACGNLKGAFLVAVVFLLFCTFVTLHFAIEVPLIVKPAQNLSDSAPLLNGAPHSHLGPSNATNGKPTDHKSESGTLIGKADSENTLNRDLKVKEETVEVFSNGVGSVLVNILTSMRHLPPAMHSVLLVMALTWLSWFPFFLFDTDWMGREVYRGDPKGEASKVEAYHEGVREGAFGLLLNSVVLGVSSFLIEPMCRRMGARVLWAISNFIVFVCMASTAVISLISITGHAPIKTASLVLFAVLGFPLAITYSVPFSVTAELTADTGGGQGLATGVLNLAIVVPQMIVSLGAGPWDALFGGGNVPAFVIASISALASGVLAIRKLPQLSSSFKPSGYHGFG